MSFAQTRFGHPEVEADAVVGLAPYDSNHVGYAVRGTEIELFMSLG